ncbi:MAG: ABC transporter ATP-binding protein [Candidatus Omnitrophota bacterium]
MKTFLKEYLRILKFAKGFRGIIALSVIFMALCNIFEGISLGTIIPLLDKVFTNNKIVISANVPSFVQSFIDWVNFTDSNVLLNYFLIFLPFVFIAKGITNFAQDYLMNIVGQGIARDVRNKLYFKFQELSLDFYGRQRTGELMSRITNDVTFIANAFGAALKDMAFESMKVVIFAMASFWIGFMISWKLPFIAFFVLPIIIIPVVKLGKRIKKFTIATQNKMADLNSLMSETIQGAYIVKAFSRQGYEFQRFKNLSQEYFKFILKTKKRTLALSPLTEIIGVVGVVFAIRFIADEIVAGRVSFGIFAGFLAFLLSTIRPLKKLSNVHAINQQAMAASLRIHDILDQEVKVKDKSGTFDLTEFKDSVEFKDVWFSYGDDDQYALKDINLKVKKGHAMALVGPSGAGKSTLISLLMRFYDPQKGSITVDGLDLRDIKVESLRCLVSVVSQDMVLFNTSIRENIAYGKAGATEEEILEASKKAHAYEFIESMPVGFSTIIGDRGFRLSGGQKQRIAIARAILKDAPILILDEATSQLDSTSEQLIQQAIETLMSKKTSFIIAHRLSTVQRSNSIAVIDKGRIVEQGTHSSLLTKATTYKKLYELQFSV